MASAAPSAAQEREMINLPPMEFLLTAGIDLAIG